MATPAEVIITRIKDVRKHPNADRLDIAVVLGYQVATPRGTYNDGDRVVYFPADSLIPSDLAEGLGVKNYLRGKDKNRVACVALRGESSFGLVVSVPVELQSLPDGENVAERFGVTKYEPPMLNFGFDAAEYDSDIDSHCERFTDIQNGRIHTDVFTDGEPVIVTEKIHGCNSKVGVVNDIPVACSMGRSVGFTGRRKHPVDKEGILVQLDDPRIARSTYWFPWSLDPIRHFLYSVDGENVLVYGEIYGGSIQSNMNYGHPRGQILGFRVFDINVDGQYLDWDILVQVCNRWGMELVPVLYEGPFDFAKVNEMSDGPSTICPDHHREGVVVRALHEGTHPKVGRRVLKYIGTTYELKKKFDFKDV